MVQKLTSDPALLQNVLSYHVVPEELACSELYNNRVLDTLNAQGKIRVNEYSSVSRVHAELYFSWSRWQNEYSSEVRVTDLTESRFY